VAPGQHPRQGGGLYNLNPGDLTHSFLRFQPLNLSREKLVSEYS
jgi:hypothetical protein